MPINGSYPSDNVRGSVHIGGFNPPQSRPRVGCFWWAVIAVLLLAIAAGATKAGGLW